MSTDAHPSAINLADEPAFALAGFRVHPAILEVEAAGWREALEPRVMQVLVALAHRRGAVVSRDELIQLCWGGRIVGEDAITRCVARLRKLARAHGGFEIETIPRVGVRLTEGPRRIATRGALHLGAVVAATLAAALLAAALGWWLLRFLDRPSENLRIAVEPARTTVDQPWARALAGNLTDEVQTLVAASGIQTSDSGGLSRPDYSLDSVVAPEGQQARISLHLVDGRSGARVWSGEVIGRPTEARRRAAVKAAGATQCAWRGRAPGAGPIGDGAFAQYLRACVQANDPEAATEVLTLFEQVTLRAPRFAPGHAGLAIFAAVSAKDVDEPLKSSLRQKGRAEAERALQLNPSEGAAFVALELLVAPRSNWTERQRLLQQGLALDPANYALLSREAQVLAALGRLSEAEAFHRRAVTLNPFAANPAAELALTMDARGELDKARATIDQAYASWPENPQVQAVRFEIEALHGDPQRAAAMLRDPAFAGQLANPQERAVLVTVMEAKTSRAPQQLARARQTVRAAEREKLWPPLAVRLLATLGDVDGAFAVAEDAARTHDAYEPVYLFGVAARPMRSDPRFMRLARTWGMTDYWRRSGRWPDFCADPGLPYDCQAAAARLG